MVLCGSPCAVPAFKASMWLSMWSSISGNTVFMFMTWTLNNDSIHDSEGHVNRYFGLKRELLFWKEQEKAWFPQPHACSVAVWSCFLHLGRAGWSAALVLVELWIAIPSRGLYRKMSGAGVKWIVQNVSYAAQRILLNQKNRLREKIHFSAPPRVIKMINEMVNVKKRNKKI